MVLNNAPISWIGMLYKHKEEIMLFFFSIMIFGIMSCRGFYEPITISIDVPEGPPEFQSGYRSGCRSGLGARNFANAFVYSPDYGSGIYQHDSVYATGWSMGWFACVINQATFVAMPERWALGK